jgi:hypothetical protein
VKKVHRAVLTLDECTETDRLAGWLAHTQTNCIPETTFSNWKKIKTKSHVFRAAVLPCSKKMRALRNIAIVKAFCLQHIRGRDSYLKFNFLSVKHLYKTSLIYNSWMPNLTNSIQTGIITFYDVRKPLDANIPQVYIDLYFPSNTTIYQLTRISLCITEFIGRTMSLHVSARGSIHRRYINNLILLNYAFYMDPYISLVFLWSPLYAVEVQQYATKADAAA